MSINFIRIAVTKYNLDFSDFVTGESVYYYTMRDKNNLVLIYPTLETPTDIVTLKNYFSFASNKINVQATIGEGYYEALSGHLNLFSDYSLSQKAVSHKATFVAESVIGSKYNDTVRTGEYADGIVSGDGNDKIYAGNGDDVVCGEDGADYIDGGAGNDVLFGGDGNDTIKGGDGKDTIYGDFASYETMLALVPENYSKYMIENKDDVINAISKANGNNIINGGNGDDIIYGGKGNDKISGDNGDDEIDGGAGKNIINGGNGNDTIYLGHGNDTVNGGKGINTYIVTNDCDDETTTTLIDGKGTDIIDLTKVTTNYNFDDNGELWVNKELNNDLELIYFNDYSDEYHYNKIILPNYFKTKGKHDIKVKLNDGNGDIITKNLKDIILVRQDYAHETKNLKINGTIFNDDIIGGQGNDTITGGLGNNTILFSDDFGDFGNDTINLTKNENLTIKFLGYSEEDLLYKVSGNNLKITVKNSDNSVTLKNYAKTNVVGENGSVKLIIDGEEYDLANTMLPIIYNENDIKRGTVTGSALAETFNLSDLSSPINPKNNGGVTINANAGKDKIAGSDYNDKINGGDGDDIIDGGEGDDIIHGGKNDDIIIGGKGNDKLYGDEGTNLLFFKEGDGNDIIYMNSKGSDKLIFDEETLLSIIYEKNGNDLVIKYGSENDTVTVSKYFSTKNPSVDRIYTGKLDNNGNIVYDEDDYLSLKNNIILIGEDGDIERTINDKPQTIKGKRYVGNEYNNIVVSSTKYDLIQTYDNQNEYIEESNDYIYMQSKWGYADGGYGDDIYVVKSLANETVINDVDGNDTLKISDSKKNINVLFDVDSDGKIIDDTICFMNKSAMNKLLSKGIKPNSGIHINGNNQDSGIIERIETSDGYYISDTTINTIATNVASWLSSNPKEYSSSMEVLMNGDRDEIASIMKCYQTIEWCKQI